MERYIPLTGIERVPASLLIELVAAISVTAINVLIARPKSTVKAAATLKTATCVTNVMP